MKTAIAMALSALALLAAPAQAASPEDTLAQMQAQNQSGVLQRHIRVLHQGALHARSRRSTGSATIMSTMPIAPAWW